jgi:aryl-alcohol dehydrogenase-like predicted oxidoreductase
MSAMRAYGLGLLPYFSLASGLLTGKYKRNAPLPADDRLTKTQRLTATSRPELGGR